MHVKLFSCVYAHFSLFSCVWEHFFWSFRSTCLDTPDTFFPGTLPLAFTARALLPALVVADGPGLVLVPIGPWSALELADLLLQLLHGV